MTWRKTFRDALGADTWAPRFAVESVHNIGDGTIKWPDVKLSSHRRPGYLNVIAEAPVYSSARLTPRTWASSNGGWSFLLSDATSIIRRGAFLQIMCGVRDPGGGVLWERIGLCQVVTTTRQADNHMTVSCRDVIAALNGRVTTDKDKLSFFSDAGTANTIALDYTVGDSTVTLASNTGYLKEGAKGVFQMTSDLGAEFLLTFTGTSGATQLTGVSATGQFGTTAGNATVAAPDPAGNTISAARLFRPPSDGLRGILSGYVAGSPSFPSEWHAGYPDEWYDHRDGEAWQAAQNDTGGLFIAQLVLLEPELDGQTFLKGWLAQLAGWAAMRQGQVTYRCATMPRDYPMPGVYVIDDSWIDRIEIEQYDSSLQDAYHEYVVLLPRTAATATTTVQDARDMPAQALFTHEITDLWNNEAAVLTRIAQLTAAQVNTLPQRWKITGHDLRFAQMCMGDTIEYGDRRGTVLGAPVDWQAGTAQLVVSFLDPNAPGLR